MLSAVRCRQRRAEEKKYIPLNTLIQKAIKEYDN